jgi:hypothetical protein
MDQQPVRVSSDHIMQVGMGFWASKALLSALELDLFSILAKAPADCATLRAALGIHERGARDFLDALVALGFLRRENGLYSNAPDAEAFLDRAKPSFIGGFLEFANQQLYGVWELLPEALRTGLPQTEARVSNTYKVRYADPAGMRNFLAGMSAISAGAAEAIARTLDWTRHASFLDLGTAQGLVPVTLARAHPHLRGIGFDLPPVRPAFEEFVTEAGLGDRLRFVGGDFFRDTLPEADAVIMGHILHNWSLEEKLALIGRAFDTLPAGGLLVVYDTIIDDARRENAFGLLMSLNMLIRTPGGFDYTAAECQDWMRSAGFRDMWTATLGGGESLVVGRK